VLPAPAAAAEERLGDAEQDGDTHVARACLDELLKAHPGDWRLLARRARLAAGEARRAEAGADDARASAAAPADALADWYRLCAIEQQAADRPEAALWYLDRLAAARPDDWAAQARRAAVLGQLGRAADRAAAVREAMRRGADAVALARWARAAAAAADWPAAVALYTAAAERGPLNRLDTADYAMACVRVGDAGRYRAVCEGKLRGLGDSTDGRAVGEVGWVCLLGPGAFANYTPLLDRVERAMRALPPDERDVRDALLSVHGCLLYRAGRYAEALERLGATRDPDAATPLFLAMTCHRLGRPAEAREYWDKASARFAREDGVSESMRPHVALLRDEAERELRTAPPAPGPAAPPR
jgi:tetratricopeptide (TPR) repeat protein